MENRLTGEELDIIQDYLFYPKGEVSFAKDIMKAGEGPVFYEDFEVKEASEFELTNSLVTKITLDLFEEELYEITGGVFNNTPGKIDPVYRGKWAFKLRKYDLCVVVEVIDFIGSEFF